MIDLLRWDGEGAPPPRWDRVIEDALSSDLPEVLTLALARIPPSASPMARALVLEQLDNPDAQVRHAALAHVRHDPDPAYREPLLAMVRVADGSELSTAWSHARQAGVPLSVLMRIGIDRLGPDAPNLALLSLLGSGSGCRTLHWPAHVEPDDIARLKEAWSRFVATHALALDAGTRPTIAGRYAHVDLVPSGFSCTLPDGRIWP